MIREFREFINNGNVFEAAVGLILALAFAPVVQGLVDNIIMPIVARFFGQPDFSNIRIGLGGEFNVTDDAGTVIGTDQAYIEIGTWITTLLGFILLAFVVFMLVRVYNRATNTAMGDDGPSEVDLLIEIRDNLAR